MKESKVLKGLMIFSVISLMCVGLVSAGFFDFLKGGDDSDLEGELPLSTDVGVEITGSQNPPEIVDVSTVNDSTRIVSAGSSEIWQFSFLVYSDGTPSYLPPNGGFANGSVNDSSGNWVTDAACSKSGEVLDDGTYGKSGNTLANYTCEVTMQYYYNPGIWTITANVEDAGSNSDTNNTKTFTLTPLNSFDIEPDPVQVNWTAIALGANPSSADNELKIINDGNNDIAFGSSPLQITATKLNGTTTTDEAITADKFGAADVTTCGVGDIGTELVDDSATSIDPFDVAAGPTAENNLTFCLDTITGISVQGYTTTATEGLWDVSISWD